MFHEKRPAALDQARNTQKEQPGRARYLGAYSESSTKLHQSGYLHFL